jgi:hypothetical protein
MSYHKETRCFGEWSETEDVYVCDTCSEKFDNTTDAEKCCKELDDFPIRKCSHDCDNPSCRCQGDGEDD